MAAEAIESWVDHVARIRRALLLALVCLVPTLVIFGVGLRDPFNTPKVGLLILGVTVAGALAGCEAILGRFPSGLFRLAVPVVCFVVPFSLAWYVSPDRDFALWGWDYGRYQGLVPYLLAVALGALIGEAFVGRVHQVIWALAAAGTFVAVYGIVQFFGWDLFPGGPGWFGSGRPLSTLGNPNFTGGFLAITLAATIPLAFLKDHRGKVATVMAYLMAVGLGRSYSQGAWVAGIAGVAVSLGILLARRWDRARVAGVALAILLAVGSVGTVLLAMAGVELGVLSTVRSRGLTWETSMRAAEEELLLGHGLNSFGQVQRIYRSDEAAADQVRRGSVPDDPHSVPLAMLVNAGLLTFLGFVGIIVWFLTKAAAVPGGETVGAAVTGALTAYLLQALVSIDEVALRVTFWICLGAMAAYAAGPRPREGHSPAAGEVGRARLALSGAVAVAACVAGVVWALGFVETHKV